MDEKSREAIRLIGHGEASDAASVRDAFAAARCPGGGAPASEAWTPASAAADMKTTLWCRQVGNRCADDAAMVARGCGGDGADKVLSESLLQTLVAQAMMASDAVQEEEAAEKEAAADPACCFCSAGGDGDGACLTVKACRARALDGYKCGSGDGGCEWGPGGAIDPRPSCQ